MRKWARRSGQQRLAQRHGWLTCGPGSPEAFHRVHCRAPKLLSCTEPGSPSAPHLARSPAQRLGSGGGEHRNLNTQEPQQSFLISGNGPTQFSPLLIQGPWWLMGIPLPGIQGTGLHSLASCEGVCQHNHPDRRSTTQGKMEPQESIARAVAQAAAPHLTFAAQNTGES